MEEGKNKLIYPGDPEFDFWLSQPPPGWKEAVAKNNCQPFFAVTPDSSIPKLISEKELNELTFDAGLYWDTSEENEETICYYPDYFE